MQTLTALLAGGLLAVAVPAAGQNNEAPSSEPGTELDVLVGAGTTATHTGPVVAGIAGWRFASWVRGEARGMWLMRGGGADAFAADLGAAVHLAPGSPAHPYVGGGFGLYRASFDSATSTMSSFYARRVANRTAADGQEFTDPAWRLSAGIDWRPKHNLSLRPEASALFVRRDGRGETIGLFALRIGYRFSDRVATP